MRTIDLLFITSTSPDVLYVTHVVYLGDDCNIDEFILASWSFFPYHLDRPDMTGEFSVLDSQILHFQKLFLSWNRNILCICLLRGNWNDITEGKVCTEALYLKDTMGIWRYIEVDVDDIEISIGDGNKSFNWNIWNLIFLFDCCYFL